MAKYGDLEIIIPAYNEEAAIGDVVKGARQVLGGECRIVVVDDASLDRTSEVARAAGAEVIRHGCHIGNGAAIKTGLRNAKAGFVAFMDADGQHAPQELRLLLDSLGDYDMVVGARDFSKPSLRNAANLFYNAFASYVTRFRIADLTSGFRVVKREAALKFIYLLPNTFSYPTTLTLAFLKSGRTVKYVPVKLRPRVLGKSKIRLFRDGAGFFLIITKITTIFSPFRVFLPVSALLFLAAAGHYAYTFIFFHRFTNMSVLLFTSSLMIFMLGLISEQISQLRMDRTE